MATLKCATCNGTGKSKNPCDCWCSKCIAPVDQESFDQHRSYMWKLLERLDRGLITRAEFQAAEKKSSTPGKELVDCPRCKRRSVIWFGLRKCPRCEGKGEVWQVCSACSGTGRDPSCPRCKGRGLLACPVCVGLNSLDLRQVLPSLDTVQNSVEFYDNDNPERNYDGACAVLSLAEVIALAGRECKEAFGRTATAVSLAAFRGRDANGARDIHRVGPDQYIYVGYHSTGLGANNWNFDAGQKGNQPT
jgi:hypothetical protein